MPGTPDATERDSTTRRRRVLIATGILLLACLIVLSFVLVVDTVSGGKSSLLVGWLTSDRITHLTIVVSFALISVGLCLIPMPLRSLWLVIPARICAVGATCLAAFLWTLTAEASVTPLLNGGCPTGYVVVERSFLLAGSGTVYRSDGIFVSAVAYTSGDDGYRPFEDEAYVVEGDDPLRVWYTIDGSPGDDQAVSTLGQPDLVLPALIAAAEPSCDPQDAAPRGPIPDPTTPTEPSPVTSAEAETARDAMVRRSLDAAVGPVEDAAGTAADQAVFPMTTVACDENGAQTTTVLDLRTADNARSLEQILAEWDNAGYLADRAMQEDLRYSDSLPIERMSIRDTTTIDGLIHLRITTRCTAG